MQPRIVNGCFWLHRSRPSGLKMQPKTWDVLFKLHGSKLTYNEIIRMFVHDAGYQIEKITMNGSFNDEEEKLADELVKLGNAEKFMYRAFQYQVVARL